MTNTYITKIFLIITLFMPQVAFAKLYNNYDQNVAQYGQPIEVKEFPSKLGFTGYVTYSIDKDWRLKAFFSEGKCRLEHLFPQPHTNPKLDREQVKQWAFKMFELKDRGAYMKQSDMPKVQGHFFQKGLVAYEYLIKGRSKVGFEGVKVTVYEGGQHYSKNLNPKAYL